MSRICVSVRKRPLNETDKDIVTVQSPFLIVEEPKIKYDLTPYTERHQFVFDDVFNAGSDNGEVYERSCRPLIDTLFSNGNATCFAYGQTGSGKTHTMLGNGKEPGLYAIAAKDIFARARPLNAEVYISFYEIYGRKLFDLLNDKAKLVAREDGDKVINICGLSEHRITDIEGMFDIIKLGSAYRAAGQTSANAESSRSHAVLQMEVRDTNRRKNIGRISFIDLAGNERGADTFDCDRKTRMEGAEINKSLLALKECIRALGMGKSHVPFRGSVLTEVLRDSFLGNSRTTMIATVSASSTHCENTLNTLRYTQRVKDLGGETKMVVDRELAPNGAGDRRRTNGARRSRAAEQLPPQSQQPPAAKRPEWIDDFNAEDDGKNEEASGVFGGPGRLPPRRRMPNVSTSSALGGEGARRRSVGTSNAAAGPPQTPASSPAGRHGNGDRDRAAAAAPPKDRRSVALPPAAHSPHRGKAVVAVKDPKIANIVLSHLKALEPANDEDSALGVESDESATDFDDDDFVGPSAPQPSAAGAPGSGDGPPALQKNEEKQVRRVHGYLVDEISKTEEKLVVVHRKHVDSKMSAIKEEINAIQSLEESDSVDEYVTKVRTLLLRQRQDMDKVLELLTSLSSMLRDEEELSKTLQSTVKTSMRR